MSVSNAISMPENFEFSWVNDLQCKNCAVGSECSGGDTREYFVSCAAECPERYLYVSGSHCYINEVEIPTDAGEDVYRMLRWLYRLREETLPRLEEQPDYAYEFWY
jgi:coenzyme F420-reducing hydrogenase gamma subunit